ncbi:TPA: hypothetical protein OD827_004292 [Escherichia coli]|nr:hypothetical protein [Escherichia coli]
MKQQYQTRYEWLHESYQKWLTGFTRHAVPDLICGLSASRRLSSSHYCLFIVPKRDLLNQGLRR